MRAEIELIGICGRTRPDADLLRGRWKRMESGEQDGSGNEQLSQSKSKHAPM